MRILFSLFSATLATCMMAETGTWNSSTVGSSIAYTVLEATGTPVQDINGRVMTIVYLENLGLPKIGQNTNAEDVAWLRQQGYQVIELDYGHHSKAVSPYINQDIIAINQSLKGGTFCQTSCSEYRSYILMEGYRIKRDIAYYHDDPTVYNFPDVYKDSKGDSLYLDLVYPANPSTTVPVLVTFSYSNSFATNDGGSLTDRNKHKRMYLPYFWGGFNDSFVEGASAVGLAWAVCDHPKYCDWGQGKYTGGANKSLGAIEVNPDAVRKVKSAIRTIRGIGRDLGLNSQVAVTGFSRGSTAAALAVGDRSDDTQEDTARGLYPKESSAVNCAILGPGVFDYSQMAEQTREYKNMSAYVSAFPTYGWDLQGAVGNIVSRASAPCLFYYNSDDDSNYRTCALAMQSLLDSLGVETEVLTDYGTGHSVPQQMGQLLQMYQFLTRQVGGESQLKKIEATQPQSMLYDLQGRNNQGQNGGYSIGFGQKVFSSGYSL